MAPTRVGDPVLKKTTGGRANGVFKGKVTWELKVEVSADPVDMLCTSVVAVFSDSLPFEGNELPGFPLVTCRGVESSSTNTAGLYTYTASYSDENSSDEEKGTNDNPLLDRPIVLPIANMVTSPMTRDRDDYAILNAAGDPLLVSREDNTLGFKISSKVADIPSYLLGVVNTVNAAEITVYGLVIPPETARFVLPSDWWSTPKNRNDIAYFDFKFELQLDFRNQHKGWPLDAGFRKTYFYDNGTDPFTVGRKNITGEDGSEVSEPVPLDPTSNPAGDQLVNPTPETVQYRETGRYALADYTVLPGVSS